MSKLERLQSRDDELNRFYDDWKLLGAYSDLTVEDPDPELRKRNKKMTEKMTTK